MSTSHGFPHSPLASAGAGVAATRLLHEPLGRLFLRFLRFGSLAWGEPVAQIAMIRQELVAEEKWVTPQHFNRVLAMYQVLPGPEAHELCVYFGMLSRGRIGGILAGLGFMLPGFMLVSLRDHVSCGRRAYVLAKQGLTSLVVAGTAVAGFALRFVSM